MGITIIATGITIVATGIILNPVISLPHPTDARSSSASFVSATTTHPPSRAPPSRCLAHPSPPHPGTAPSAWPSPPHPGIALSARPSLPCPGTSVGTTLLLYLLLLCRWVDTSLSSSTCSSSASPLPLSFPDNLNLQELFSHLIRSL
jgi:hypothetical protein